MTLLHGLAVVVILVAVLTVWTDWRAFTKAARHHGIDQEFQQVRQEMRIREWTR
jgi:hypothetical protein